MSTAYEQGWSALSTSWTRIRLRVEAIRSIIHAIETGGYAEISIDRRDI